jgi:hypothetical protein
MRICGGFAHLAEFTWENVVNPMAFRMLGEKGEREVPIWESALAPWRFFLALLLYL